MYVVLKNTAVIAVLLLDALHRVLIFVVVHLLVIFALHAKQHWRQNWESSVQDIRLADAHLKSDWLLLQ